MTVIPFKKLKGVTVIDCLMLSYGFLLTSIYWSGITGAGTSPRWMLISIVTVLFVLYLEPKQFTWLHILGLLFIAWNCLTLLWTDNLNDSKDALFKLSFMACAFMLGIRLNTLKYTFIGLALGITLSSLLVLFGDRFGLFANEHIVADTAALVIVGLIVYRLYKYIWLVIPCLFAGTSSRAAMLGLGICFITYIWNKSKLIAVGLTGLFGIVLVLAIQYRSETVFKRLELWVDTLKALSWFGNGIGSYHSSFPLFAENINTLIERPRFAHNDLLQIWFELGFVGLCLALGFIGSLLNTRENEKYIIIIILGISLSSYQIYLPVQAFVFAITAGYIASKWNSVFAKTSFRGVPLQSSIAAN